MGLTRDRTGNYSVQRRIPDRLQGAVARLRGGAKERITFQKKALGTKSVREANIRAKPVLMGFDLELAQAEALTVNRPLRTSLSLAEVNRMAEHHYGNILRGDDADRLLSPGARLPGSEKALERAGLSGLSDDHIAIVEALEGAREALATADLQHVAEAVSGLLEAFQVALDPDCDAYRRLAMAILEQEVMAYSDLQRRRQGVPITAPIASISLPAASSSQSGTLLDAFDGWCRFKSRAAKDVRDHRRAVDQFLQMHGTIPLTTVTKAHARAFREAVQDVPLRRPKKLTTLSELADFGRAHPELEKISPATVNKHIGAVQALMNWGANNGVVPDHVQWADPFASMRLEVEESDRIPFDRSDLQAIFASPFFHGGAVPEAGRGYTAIWLPLIALFTGARQGEVAGLRTSDIRPDEDTGIPLIWIVRDLEAGRTLKTRTSDRVVPVHSQLIALGFLDYVRNREKEGGDWLFPGVAPDGLLRWCQWFGRFLRNNIKITDPNKVFHSFRHGAKEAMRRAQVGEELHDAITGHANKSVGRSYGSKVMLHRWGAETLQSAIEAIRYQGLDLSLVKTSGITERKRLARKA